MKLICNHKLCTPSNMELTEQAYIEDALQKIGDRDVEISELSCNKIESSLKESGDQFDQIIQAIIAKSTLVKGDTTIYLRYVSLISRIMGMNEEYFVRCSALGLPERICELCFSDDYLVKILAIELLSNISKLRAGIIYLTQANIISWLTEQAYGDDNSSTDSLLCNEALRVLTNVFEKSLMLNVPIWHLSGSRAESNLQRVKGMIEPAPVLGKRFLDNIVRHIESMNESSVLAGLYAVSSFASCSLASLQLIIDDDTLLAAWLSILNRKVELQACCLHSIAKVFRSILNQESVLLAGHNDSKTMVKDGKLYIKDDPSLILPASPHDLFDTLRQLFLAIGKTKGFVHTMDYLLKLVQQPITETRLAAYDLIHAMVGHPGPPWGILEIMRKDSLGALYIWDEVSDVSREVTKAGKEWRFSIVAAMESNPYKDSLPLELREDITKKHSRGPFFVPRGASNPMTMEL